MLVRIKVKPNAKQNLIKINEDGTYSVFLTAAPIEGKANDQLIKMLSDYFKVAKSLISIKSGLKSRDKLVIIGD